MKKILVVTLMILLFLTLVTSDAFSITTEDVLENMAKAQGGKKNLARIQDSTTSGSLVIVPSNLNGSISTYWKSPNKRRSDIEVTGIKIIQAYDGKIAWIDNPTTGGIQELPEKFGKVLKRQALGYDTLFNYKKYGITYTFKGKEKVKDKDYFVLEQTYSDGHKTTHYVDPETYLIYKSKTVGFNQAGTEVESEIFPSDYKKVEGVLIPHTLTVFQENQEYLKMTFDKVSFNSGVEGTFFNMPE